MSDHPNPESSTTGKPANESHNENGDAGPGSHPQQNGINQDSRFNYKDIIIELALIAVGSGFFSLFNEYLDFVGVHGSKPWCILSGLVCFELAVAHFLFKKLSSAKVVWWAFGVIVFVETIVLCFAVFLVAPKQPSKPHLTFILNTAEFPNLNLQLTNKLLFVEASKSNTFGIIAILVLPIASNNSPAKLRLSVLNDSRETVDGMLVAVTFTDDVECVSSPNWLFATRFFDKTRSVAFTDNLKLFPDTLRLLDELSFKPIGKWPSAGDKKPVIFLSVETSGIRRSLIAFRLFCPVVTNIVAPRLLLPGDPYP